MYRRSILLMLALSAVASRALCHHDLHELGHHWELPVYSHELNTQLIGMGTVAGLILIVKLARKKVG